MRYVLLLMLVACKPTQPRTNANEMMVGADIAVYDDTVRGVSCYSTPYRSFEAFSCVRTRPDTVIVRILNPEAVK